MKKKMLRKNNKIGYFFLFMLLLSCKENKDPFPQDKIELSISNRQKLRLDKYEGFLDLSYDCILEKDSSSFAKKYINLIDLLKQKKWKYNFISVEGLHSCSLQNSSFKDQLKKLNIKAFGTENVKFEEEDGVLYIIPKKSH